MKWPPTWILPGVRVDYHATIGGPVTIAGAVVRAGPYRMGDHWSVWLEGKPGGVDVEACTPARVETGDKTAMSVIRPKDGLCGSEPDPDFDKEIQALEEVINRAIRRTKPGAMVWIEAGRRNADDGLVPWSPAALHWAIWQCTDAGWIVEETEDQRSRVFFLRLRPHPYAQGLMNRKTP